MRQHKPVRIIYSTTSTIVHFMINDQPTSALNGSAYLHLFSQNVLYQQPESAEILKQHQNSYFSTTEPNIQTHGTPSTSDVTGNKTNSEMLMSPVNCANHTPFHK